MNSIRDERKLLFFTYLLCFVCFTNLGMLKQPFDKGAVIIAAIACLLIAYSHFVIRKFFPDGDKYIFILACILAIIGLAVIYRIDLNKAIDQVIWFALGVTGYILIVILLPDLKSFAKYRYVYLVCTLIFMSIALLFGTEINGSKNWIMIHGHSFQPSEFGKLFFVAYLASTLRKYKSFLDLIEPALVSMFCLGFLVLQKDLGTALIFFGIAVTMLYIATSKLKYTLTCFGLFGGGAYISYKLFSHVRDRVLIWKNPWPYYSTTGYQIIQSMFSIASGGLLGSGLGQGHPEFIPINTTDFIFSVICEELGLLVAFGIIIMYFLLFYRGMRAAVFVEDVFSRLMAVGISATIAAQAIVIIGGVTNMIPLTGITLPLISYGGSSMLITFLSLGILQKISEEEWR